MPYQGIQALHGRNANRRHPIKAEGYRRLHQAGISGSASQEGEEPGTYEEQFINRIYIAMKSVDLRSRVDAVHRAGILNMFSLPENQAWPSMDVDVKSIGLNSYCSFPK